MASVLGGASFSARPASAQAAPAPRIHADDPHPAAFTCDFLTDDPGDQSRLYGEAEVAKMDHLMEVAGVAKAAQDQADADYDAGRRDEAKNGYAAAEADWLIYMALAKRFFGRDVGQWLFTTLETYARVLETDAEKFDPAPLSAGRFKEAVAARRCALDSLLKLHSSPTELMEQQFKLAQMYQEHGDEADAEPYLRAALSEVAGAKQADQAHVDVAARALGKNLVAQKKWAEAEPVLRMIKDQRNNFALDDLAHALEGQGKLTEAEAIWRELSKTGAHWVEPLALNLALQRRWGEAADVYGPEVARRDGQSSSSALQGFSSVVGEYSPTWEAHLTLARWEMKAGRFNAAAADYGRACPSLKRSAYVDSEVRDASVRKMADDYARISGVPTYAQCSRELATAATSSTAQAAPAGFEAAQEAVQNEAGATLMRMSARRVAEAKGAGSILSEMDARFAEEAEATADFNRKWPPQALAQGVPQERMQDFVRDLTDEGKAVNASEAALKPLIAELVAKVPDYLELRSPTPLKIEVLQAKTGADAALLRPNEALILWMLAPGQDKGLVFAVSKTGFAWASMGLTGDEIAADVSRLRRQIDPGGYGLRDFGTPVETPGAFDRKTAHALYTALLGDKAVQAVTNGDGIDTLLIVPSGPLISLPPSLLVADEPTGSDADPAALASTHWLIRDKAVAVLPTVASLRALRQALPASRKTPDLKLLALADPDFKGTGQTPQPPVAGAVLAFDGHVGPASGFQRDGKGTQALADLRPLYGTLEEGKTLASILAPGDATALLLGPDASKTNLLRRQRDGALARTRVLAFSTHGLLTGDFTGLTEPALALAHPPAAGADPSDDGLLKASDAATLTLNADWVVLSACNTAAGDGQGAEGLSGLARAFFHAGASALLVSHWRVDDEATKALIADTFRFQQDGMTKALALRASMLKMLDDPSRTHVAPRFWAPFVVVGEAR